MSTTLDAANDKRDVENAVCAFWIGMIAIAVGVGFLAGPGWGAVVFGAPLVVFAQLAAWVAWRRQRAAKAGEP